VCVLPLALTPGLAVPEMNSGFGRAAKQLVMFPVVAFVEVPFLVNMLDALFPKIFHSADNVKRLSPSTRVQAVLFSIDWRMSVA